MSPVCTVQVGAIVQMTPKCKKGGSNPVWNTTLKPLCVSTL